MSERNPKAMNFILKCWPVIKIPFGIIEKASSKHNQQWRAMKPSRRRSGKPRRK